MRRHDRRYRRKEKGDLCLFEHLLYSLRKKIVVLLVKKFFYYVSPLYTGSWNENVAHD